ncbi:MAG: STAS domain-containing protein [Burkholderiales bacterium]|nr:STAS domain-containing protein [Burkholderiales bacterium]
MATPPVKSGIPPRPAVAGTAPRPATGGAPTAAPGFSPNASGQFSTAEISDSGALSPLHEAAVLYSADYYDATAEVLKEYLRDATGKNNIRAWLMMFDFYQLTHNRKEFDALSILFTVKWERSPPVWAESEEGDPRRKEKRERKDFFPVKPGADGALLPEIDRFEVFVKEMGSARIDFGKVKTILAEEAELFSLVLQRVRRAKMHIWFNSFDEFTGLLKNCINGTPGPKSLGFWNLLFELYILDGKLNEYEELGLEYAVAFEASPPAWEAVNRPTGSAPDAPADTGKFEPAAVGFPLRGVISAASKDALGQLAAYASTHAEVVIDCGALLRIDFAFAGQFFEAIRAIHTAGKRVILSNLNELVAALLEVFGMNKHAILMRKKAT